MRPRAGRLFIAAPATVSGQDVRHKLRRARTAAAVAAPAREPPAAPRQFRDHLPGGRLPARVAYPVVCHHHRLPARVWLNIRRHPPGPARPPGGLAWVSRRGVGTAMNRDLTIKLGNCNHRRYVTRLLSRIAAGGADPAHHPGPAGGHAQQGRRNDASSVADGSRGSHVPVAVVSTRCGPRRRLPAFSGQLRPSSPA